MCVCVCVIYTHTHTHTYVYTCICIYPTHSVTQPLHCRTNPPINSNFLSWLPLIAATTYSHSYHLRILFGCYFNPANQSLFLRPHKKLSTKESKTLKIFSLILSLLFCVNSIYWNNYQICLHRSVFMDNFNFSSKKKKNKQIPLWLTYKNLPQMFSYVSCLLTDQNKSISTRVKLCVTGDFKENSPLNFRWFSYQVTADNVT